MKRRLKAVIEAAGLTAEQKSLALTCEARIVEAAAADGKKLPRFSMTAYTGGPMRLGWWDSPVVIDLAGLKVPAQHIPVRLQHDPGEGVGHTDRIGVDNGRLTAEGTISRATDAARDVAESARNGFPWQASVGASVLKYEFVKGGQSVVVNGQTHAGPLYVMRQTELAEISFVDLGADTNTSANVAAKAANPNTRGAADMNEFEKWLTALGLEAAKLTDEQKAKLQAKFDAEKAPPVPPAPPVTAAAPAPVVVPDPAEGLRAAAGKELERQAAIAAVEGISPAIQAKAVKDGWTVEKTQLEVLRAARPPAPLVTGAAKAAGRSDVLAAAVSLTLLGAGAEKVHKAPALDAAAGEFRGGIGLGQLLFEAARANGYTGGIRDLRGILTHAFRPGIAAGYSTVDISGILSATANKALLDAFLFVEQTWRDICAVRPVTDFKTITSYRLLDTGLFEEVPPGKDIEHGTLSDESFTNAAKTYGKMLQITRQDVINDDLGALNRVPAMLGRQAGLKLNDVFWTAFLDNAAFFTGTGKYLSGSGTALGVDALSTAEAAFLNKTDNGGRPLGVNPAILLVPPALSATAQQLYKGSELRDTNSSKQYLVVNPHAGKYRVAVSRYLSNSSYTGYSALAWYLLADPRDIATIEVVFLNGVQAPTIESADADFNTLGIQMRGYFDFGCAKQDARGGLKVKGEA